MNNSNILYSPLRGSWTAPAGKRSLQQIRNRNKSRWVAIKHLTLTVSLVLIMAYGKPLAHCASLTLITTQPADGLHPLSLSSDGQTVVGNANTTPWIWHNGVFTMNPFPRTSDGQVLLPEGVSADGTAVVGIGNNNDSYLFQNGIFYTLLPPLETTTYGGAGTGVTGVSGDGLSVVGNVTGWGPVIWFGTNSWACTNAFPLSSYFGTAEALAVSGDGSVAVGWNQFCSGSCTDPYQPAQWINGSISALPLLHTSGVNIPGGAVSDSGQAWGVSSDGLSIVGHATTGLAQGFALQAEAVLWQHGTAQALGMLSGTFSSGALGVANSGSRVVGNSDNRAFLWTPTDGMRYLGDVLGALGIVTNGWQFIEADAITPDGRFIVGQGYPGVFLVDLGATQTAPPVISGCPDNITTNTGPSRVSCDQVVVWTEPTASSPVGVTTFTSNYKPGDTFPVGSTTVTYTAVDSTGNSTNCSFTVTVADTTPPVLGSCPPGGPFILNSGSPPLQIAATDNCGLNLTASSLTGTVDTSSVGSKQVTFQAVDNAGNTSSQSCSYQVIYQPAGISGTINGSLVPGHQILKPVSTAAPYSVFKQGSTVPLKFAVFDANLSSVGSAGVVTSVTLAAAVNGTTSDVNETILSANEDSVFHWDPSSQLWTFNLSTKNLPKNATFFYTISLNDGTSINVQFGLR